MLFVQKKQENTDKAKIQNLSQLLNVSIITAQLLYGRGLDTASKALDFLHAGEDPLSDPYTIMGMADAVSLIHKHMEAKSQIIIYGDYDADGICAACILTKTFKTLGYNVSYYIPQREGEGYGLNKVAIDKIVAQGYGLLITVDCGISNVEEVAYAKSLGLDVIVTDHHSEPDVLPECVIVNPKLGGVDGQQNLCGAAVAMKLSHCLLDRDDVHLDLCAVATVADMVPLVGENRTLVIKGLRSINEKSNPQLNKLIGECFKKERQITAQDIAFFIAPIINAAGRVGDLDVCMQFMSGISDNPLKAAQSMIGYNASRKQIEQSIIKDVYTHLERIDLTEQKSIVLYNKKWPLGVLGIAASKVKNRFSRPVFLLGESDGKIKGSGRSVDGINIFDILNGNPELFEQYGGHSQAAGVTLKANKLNAFADYFEDAVSQCDPALLYPKTDIDYFISTEDVTTELVTELESMRPFGKGNPAPNLMAKSCKVSNLRTMGDKGQHYRANINNTSKSLTCVAFSRKLDSTAFIDGVVCDVVLSPQINRWMGREEVQGLIEYIHMRFTSMEAWQQYITGLSNEFNQSMSAQLYHEAISCPTLYGLEDNLDKLREETRKSAFGNLVIIPDQITATNLYEMLGEELLNAYQIKIGTVDTTAGENTILLAPQYESLTCEWYDNVFIITSFFAGYFLQALHQRLHLGKPMTIIRCQEKAYSQDLLDQYKKYKIDIEMLRRIYSTLKKAVEKTSIQAFLVDSERYGYRRWEVNAALTIFSQCGLIQSIEGRYILTEQKSVELEASCAYRHFCDPAVATLALNVIGN